MPYTSQMNFGQIVGRVAAYNKGASFAEAQNVVNDVVRRVYDRREGRWYGLQTKGQIISPGYYSTGSVSLTAGSPNVTGIGTAWTTAMVGQQLRVSFISPIYTIIAVPSATQLVLELPWGMPNQSTSGYFITQYYYSLPNVKFIYAAKNLQLMYRLWTNVPVSLLETWDPSRLQLYFTRILATMPPDANGNYQIEAWPAPSTPQAFPYLAYIQPPNLVNDADPLPAYIRADIIELGAIAEILLIRPKQNPGYSESLALQMSARFTKMFENELEHAAKVDEGLFRQDTQTSWEQWPLAQMDWQTGNYIGGGAFLASMSPYSVYDDY